MKTNKKIPIDLLEFSKNGKFDCLKAGQTRDWVLEHFPNPDGFEDGDNWRNGEFEIFTYGDFELHFSNDILYLIFADFFGKIEEGDSLSFTNKWIFEKDTSELNLPYVQESLTKQNIEYTSTKNDKLHAIILKTTGNVEIHFESDESTKPLDYIFSAIWILEKP